MGAVTLLAGALASGASALSASTATATASNGSTDSSDTPARTGKLTKAERAHVRQIVRDGKANGLTREQIRAEVRRYLKSIGKQRHAPKAKPTVASVP
jgi:uncharacterized membrane protein